MHRLDPRLAFALALAGLAWLLPAQAQRTLTFGVYTSERATEMHTHFAPVIDDLTEAMRKKLLGPIAIKLKIYKDYEAALEGFLKGEVDFVRFGPASYVLAKDRNPKIQLLVAEQDDGEKKSLGTIVVHRDSPVRKLADLEGKTFAFGDDNSTIGRYLAQAELARAGVLAKDLKAFQYLGRHDKVAKAVEMKEYDAGAIHIATLDKAIKDGAKLRSIATFENISKPWIARAGLPEDLCAALSQALLETKRPESLAALKVSGFLPTTDADFDFVREGMKSAAAFEGRNVTPAAADQKPDLKPTPGR